jgi:hypothetical protein
MTRDRMTHEFVEYVPSTLTDGTLYVSVRFRTVVHLCACGCKTKIATPLSPANWQLGFDGESISLSPSIGAWNLPCRSHYWIESNNVLWSTQWTDEKIRRGRDRDDQARRDYFARRADQLVEKTVAPRATAAPGAWQKLAGRLWRR